MMQMLGLSNANDADTGADGVQSGASKAKAEGEAAHSCSAHAESSHRLLMLASQRKHSRAYTHAGMPLRAMQEQCQLHAQLVQDTATDLLRPARQRRGQLQPASC